MLDEGALVDNSSDVTGTVYRGGFRIIETRRQGQFTKSGLLGPQCGAMSGGSAGDLSGLIDVGGLQGQGDYFVVLGNTVRAAGLSH
jgi:hypothetical protein